MWTCGGTCLVNHASQSLIRETLRETAILKTAQPRAALDHSSLNQRFSFECVLDFDKICFVSLPILIFLLAQYLDLFAFSVPISL